MHGRSLGLGLGFVWGGGLTLPPINPSAPLYPIPFLLCPPSLSPLALEVGPLPSLLPSLALLSRSSSSLPVELGSFISS